MIRAAYLPLVVKYIMTDPVPFLLAPRYSAASLRPVRSDITMIQAVGRFLVVYHLPHAFRRGTEHLRMPGIGGDHDDDPADVVGQARNGVHLAFRL